MSPRQLFGPSFVQVTLPSVQVEFSVPQAVFQSGRVAPSVQVAPDVFAPQLVALKMLPALFVTGYTDS